MTARKSESVSIGHVYAGDIRETYRGFECWGADGKYLFTEVTLAGARKAIFEHHKDQQETAKA